eukprot:3651467-Pyramimonas_sp.AAC.1
MGNLAVPEEEQGEKGADGVVVKAVFGVFEVLPPVRLVPLADRQHASHDGVQNPDVENEHYRGSKVHRHLLAHAPPGACR